MTVGQVAALLIAIPLLLPGGCFLIVGIGSLAEGSFSVAVAALQIAVPILFVMGVLFWLAFRRRPPRGPGGSSS
jgi:membrane protein implicated in regulation of membrane protease activity